MPTLTLELASASPPNPLQRLACLRAHTPLQMRPHLCPHHSLRFRTPASYSPWITILILLWVPQVMPPTPPSPPLTPPCTCRLPSLGLWGAFPTCLRRCLPSVHLYSAHPTCLQQCLPSLHSQLPPDMPPKLLTILSLVECLPDMPPMPLTILILV
ncbi:hypothetical protein O181_089872 [Austropuccinia psidii MF-1]|uniref:Uncharacterized protein n=1 Tax=Austropuccinia psidii MF-1 TaxID=1389203 RepID=A0A9Q3IUF2_9BASI|nr:hypothetical protein [Austropuccinia psidii MF-1]